VCLERQVVSALQILVFKRCTGLRDVAADLRDSVLFVAAECASEILEVLLSRIQQLRRALLRL